MKKMTVYKKSILMRLSKYKSEMKVILCLFSAFITTLALHCKFEIIQGVGSSTLIQSFSKISNSFLSCNFGDLIIFVAVYLLFRFVISHDQHIDKLTAIFAALFSVLYVVTQSYMHFNEMTFFTANRYQMFLACFCIVGLFLCFYSCLRALLLFLDNHLDDFVQDQKNIIEHKHFLLFGFLIIFVGWLPWILLNYPGSFCFDSQRQLMQFLGDLKFSANHPPLSTWIMGVLVTVGEFIWDKNFGCFLYILLQTIVGALVFSFGVKKLYKAGVRFKWCIVFLLFFALNPLWGCFAQWYEKDLLYAEIEILFIIYFIDIFVKKECTKKEAFLLFISGLLTTLLRNNGIYEILPSILTATFFMKGKSRKVLGVVSLCIIASHGLMSNIVYPSILNIEKGSASVLFSIPFQQTARYVSKHDNEVTDYEQKTIDKVLDYKSLAEKYNPILSDPIIGMYKDDSSKLPSYFKVWFEMFTKHPGTYISSVINGAYGYIAPIAISNEPGVYDLAGYSYLESIGIYNTFKNWHTGFMYFWQGNKINMPLVKYLSMAGLYTWIILILILITIKKKMYSLFIVFIPQIMNILICIASPEWADIRYALPVVASAPMLIGWTWYYLKKGRSKVI